MGIFCWWWLRSPGNNQNNAANVNNDGSVNYNGNNVNNDNNCVRPALLPDGEKFAVCTAAGTGSKGIGFPLDENRENRCRQEAITQKCFRASRRKETVWSFLSPCRQNYSDRQRL